jgi:hypothetical protein
MNNELERKIREQYDITLTKSSLWPSYRLGKLGGYICETFPDKIKRICTNIYLKNYMKQALTDILKTDDVTILSIYWKEFKLINFNK